MNQRQTELLEEVKAAGGQLWVEVVTTFKRRGGHTIVGQSKANTMASLLSEREGGHCPGGYRREVKLKLISYEATKQDFYVDTLLWGKDIKRHLVELL
jgi:L-amino acid N-acyltransferase YncA